MAMAKAKKALSLALAALFAAGTIFSAAPAVSAATVKKAAVVNHYNNALVSMRAINTEVLKNQDLSITANRVEITKHFKAYQASMAKETNATKKAALEKMFNSIWTAYQNKVIKDRAAATADVTVTSVAAPADVTIDLGSAFTAPSTVKATMSDNSVVDKMVVWDKTVDTKVAGETTLTGNVGGKTVSFKVTVKALALKVDSVTAKTASTFEVKFNTAVADTSKFTFTVKRDSVAVTMTPSWNTEKTVATLAYATKLVEGNYSVEVKQDTTVLTTGSVKVEKEKVAKISIVGDKLIRTSKTTGYIGYKVENQYGDDITDSALAQSITWNSTTNTQPVADRKAKMLTIVHDADQSQTMDNKSIYYTLAGMKTVTITGVDSNTGTPVTATVNVSEEMGSLSDIKLTGIKDNKDIKENSTGKFYATFEAKDVAGNVTTNYDVVSSGLMYKSGTSDELITSNNMITAKVVRDSADTKKAVIEITVTAPTQSLVLDTPVIVTAMTKTGKSSNLTINVKKKTQVESITLLYPEKEAAKGDSEVVIPFVAYDQYGEQVTAFDDLDTLLNLPSDLALKPKADGSAKLVYTGAASNTNNNVFITVSVKASGKANTLNLALRDAKVASSLSIDTTKLVTNFQKGVVSYKLDEKAFTIKDQYDRTISKSSSYYVVATTTGSSIGIVSANENGSASDIKLSSTTTSGAQTVTFTVWKQIGAAPAVATDVQRTVTFNVISDSNITGLTTGTVPVIYNGDIANWKDASDLYRGTVTIFGKNANGEKVVLAGNSILGATSSSKYIETDLDAKTDSANEAKIGLQDTKGTSITTNSTINLEADNKTEATGTINVTALIDGKIKNVSFDVKLTNEARVAKSIDGDDEISRSTSKIYDKVEVLDQYGKNLLKENGTTLVKIYKQDGTEVYANAQLDSFASGTTLTIVTNNGLAKNVVIE